MKFITAHIVKFLSSYGWHSIGEFFSSLFPTIKYGGLGSSFSIAGITAFFVHYLGISPALIPAMFIVIATEVMTGIRASSVQKKPFESWRFSRCIIKLCLWMVLFYCAHAFRNECELNATVVGALGYFFFDVLKLFFMILFVIENGTSILENKAVIDGKEKSEYVDKLKDLFEAIFGTLKNLVKNRFGNSEPEEPATEETSVEEADTETPIEDEE